jgi:hypothetical protein
MLAMAAPLRRPAAAMKMHSNWQLARQSIHRLVCSAAIASTLRFEPKTVLVLQRLAVADATNALLRVENLSDPRSLSRCGTSR